MWNSNKMVLLMSDAIDLAAQNLGGDDFGYRREALNLMRLADSLQESQR